ncbi:DMT family transporter [Qipengyuania qiaonensis]|uniref:DMT family transporter n=1 Tax=Qipengyuania qiaonensis TaxID=2867240 RepID=A0ABS7J323_9SPHN|nr:DMT family transporter [Qipengyuania qiaonensis]MBX7481671.1 DMT family transporter [Qipengyuania qiaonensis]
MKKPSRVLSGWFSGLTGVVIFSGSLPATRIAVLEIDPLFLSFARASIAGLLAVLVLLATRSKRPAREELLPLAIVSFGVVVGFPMLSALALSRMPASPSILFTALLPLSTALFAAVRSGERAGWPFWASAALGAALVAGFAWAPGSLADPLGNALMIAAVILCGLGYAEGARLTRSLGGLQVICWALLMAQPFMVPAMLVAAQPDWSLLSTGALVGLGYVSLFSMLIGFIFWYRGLALGGIAAVAQLQLLQPLLALIIAAVLLRETVSPILFLVMFGVIGCVAAARRFQPGSS